MPNTPKTPPAKTPANTPAQSVPTTPGGQGDSVTPINTRVRRKSGQRLTPQQREAAQTLFLETFAKAANVTLACRSAGIERPTFYRWLEHDTPFSIRYKWAEAEANDAIRGAIYRRAVQGIDKPLHHHGQMVTEEVIDPKTGQKVRRPVTVREYSDTLLMFLAKSRMPEFKDKQQVELSGRDGAPIETHSTKTVEVDVSKLSTEQLLTLRALLTDG